MNIPLIVWFLFVFPVFIPLLGCKLGTSQSAGCFDCRTWDLRFLRFPRRHLKLACNRPPVFLARCEVSWAVVICGSKTLDCILILISKPLFNWIFVAVDGQKGSSGVLLFESFLQSEETETSGLSIHPGSNENLGVRVGSFESWKQCQSLYLKRGKQKALFVFD